MSDPHTEECVYCGGQGRVDVSDPGPEIQRVRWETCEACGGLGHVDPQHIDNTLDTFMATACQQLEECYTVLEADTRYSVCVRPARSGEASGTYYRQANGNLQILGYSLEMPEDLHDLSAAAWEKFCSLPL